MYKNQSDYIVYKNFKTIHKEEHPGKVSKTNKGNRCNQTLCNSSLISVLSKQLKVSLLQ